MRVRRVLLSVIALMAFQICAANALDFGRVAGGILGQVLDNAVRGGNSTPVQQQPQQQQTTKYSTDYQQYMEGSAASETQVTEAPQDQGFDVHSDEPVPNSEAEDDDLFGNTGMEEEAAEESEEEEDLFGNAGIEDESSDDTGGGKDGDTIEVVATGIGKDSDSALRNALRAAVEQAVGTLVDSETMIQNDEVMNDQILSYSAGFVQSHSQIGEPKTNDGLVTVRIRAKVEKTELVQKLESASIHVSEVDGEDLFGEAITKIEQNKASEEITRKAFADFPTNVLEIRRSGKPSYNEREKKWIIPIEISVNREKYRTFVRELMPVLKRISSDVQRVTMRARAEGSGNLYIDQLDGYSHKGPRFLVCTSINDARTTTIWEVYTVPEEAIGGVSIRVPKFTVDIVDNRGDVITSGTYESPIPYIFGAGSDNNNRNTRPMTIHPMLRDLDRSGSFRILNPGDYKVTYNLSFDVSPEEFKRMKNVVCRIDK